MTHDLPVRAVADLIHVYPTLGMAGQHAAQRWYEQKAKVPAVRGALKTYSAARRNPLPLALAVGALAATWLLHKGGPDD